MAATQTKDSLRLAAQPRQNVKMSSSRQRVHRWSLKQVMLLQDGPVLFFFEGAQLQGSLNLSLVLGPPKAAVSMKTTSHIATFKGEIR